MHSRTVFLFVGLFSVLSIHGARAARDVEGAPGVPGPTMMPGIPTFVPPPAPARTAAPETAAPGRGWRALNLYGGNITCLAVSPIDPNLVVATNGHFYDDGNGLFISRDGGRTWFTPSTPLDYEITAFDAEFLPDGTLYVATYRELLRANPTLTAWEIVPVHVDGFAAIYPFKIGINPSNPNEIWLGTQQAPPNVTLLPNLIRTRDGGVHWDLMTPPWNFLGAPTGIAFNRNDASRMVVTAGGGDSDGQVWYTLNGGTDWIQSPMPKRLYTDVIHDGSRFYLSGGSTIGNTRNVGVFASDDDGATWNEQSNRTWPSRQVYDLEFDPSQPGVILAATAQGIARRMNGTWMFGLGGYVSTFCAALTPGNPDRILTGNEAFGVRRSEDGGAHFDDSSQGLLNLDVLSVASNPLNPNELAASFQSAGEIGGVYTTLDGGETWTLAPAPPLRFNAVEFAPDGRLFAAADSRTRTSVEGVYARNSAGSWLPIGPMHASLTYTYDVACIRVAPHHPDILFATGSDFSLQKPVIWRSLDNGATWTSVFVGTASTLVTELQFINDGTDQNLLAAQGGGSAMLVSHDGGNTWAEIAGTTGTYKYSLRGTPADLNTFYVSGSSNRSGLYGPSMRTLDGGTTWSPLAAYDQFDKLDVDRVNRDIVYAMRQYTFQGIVPAVARSTDGGQTFDAFDADLGNLIPNNFAWAGGPCPRLLLASDAGLYVRDIDSTPPQLSLTLEPNVLWPPDHRLKTIHAHVSASDGCDPNATFVLKSITADGSDATQDVVARIGAATTTFQLRAERPGKGDRRYLVTYTATDASGNTTDGTAVVLVPHDQSGPALSNGGETARAYRTALVSIDPNPFNPATAVMLTLEREQFVMLDVYDVHGARVRTLQSGILPAGVHRIAWNGIDEHGGAAASGVYFFRFVAGSHIQTMKALLIK
jgi:photosystem II stability/assembly factor-like uncharacterized protein